MRIAIYHDKHTLSQHAAEYIMQVARESIALHGRFTIALTGGTTPGEVYSLLGSEPIRSQIDWQLVHIFWGDERCVPLNNPESNFYLAQEVLLDNIATPKSQIHPMPADQLDREEASQAYVVEMQTTFGTHEIPNFDLIHLGMGPEGHTASLFPHQASLHEKQRLVMPVSVPKPPPDRLTFTPPLLNAARNVLFLVTGSEKADALHAVIEGEYQPDEYPAQIVRPTHGEVVWMLDKAVAQNLQANNPM
ncbi:MAG TPA: 6-phosphogluconolactonase [Ktedonobacteraceae bacterium]|nr:6-phosphogluconolactonase [Ktedonobacteraceae bacterium]